MIKNLFYPLLKDNSKSVTDNINQKIQKLCNQLSRKYDVKLFSFSENLTEDFIDSNFGNSTNYSNLFNEIHNKFQIKIYHLLLLLQMDYIIEV